MKWHNHLGGFLFLTSFLIIGITLGQAEFNKFINLNITHPIFNYWAGFFPIWFYMSIRNPDEVRT